MVAAACVLVPGRAVSAGPDPASAAGRPNIVVISTDDQTVESMRVMSSVNRLLAAEGAVFANSFASIPLCCPSRATLLTGQYSHNHGVVGNHLINGLSRLDQSNTLPVWLQRAGYATVFVGKYLNGYGVSQARQIPPGWSEWYAGLKLAYFSHSMNRNGVLKRYGENAGSYQTDVYARTAVEGVRRRAADPKPFFLWLSLFAPHVGGPREPDDPPGVTTPVPAPRHRNVFAAELVPASRSFNEPDTSDKPASIRRRPLLGPSDEAAIAEKYRQRLEALLAVDEAVESVVAALRASGELDNTLIVFTSDNGFLQGEHRIREGKEVLYEPSIRVPLIVRGPRVKRGIRVNEPVSNVDLAATFVEIAGAKPRRRLDGRSLLPLAADAKLHWGRDLLLARGPAPDSVTTWRVTAIRTPRYLYAEHATGERELYDLEQDPEQLQSLHHDPARDSVEAGLAGRLAALRDCAGASCSKGPALGLLAVMAGKCARALRVFGEDERLVARVAFLDGKRVIGRDADAPFEQPLARTSVPESLRALVTLADGRRLTLQTAPRHCR